MKKCLIVLLVFLSAATVLSAQEEGPNQDVILFENNGFIFTSYLRTGAYLNSDATMVEGGGSWNVAGGYNGMRFMNEANYNEWMLGYESPRDSLTWWGAAYVRLAFDIPDFSTGWLNISADDYGIMLPEAFFRIGFAEKDWNFWAGRRYNDKVAVGMMDYYIANLDGNGVGMENISVGDASMNVHWLFSYSKGAGSDDTFSVSTFPGKQTAAFVFNAVPAGDHFLSFIIAPSFQSAGDATVDTNDDGTIDGINSYDAGGGGFITAKYNRDCFFGLDGGSELYASVGFGTGANQHADTSLAAYDWDDWSVFTGMQAHALVSDMFTFSTTLHYEHRSYEANVNDWMSFGFRPMFKIARIFALQFEYDLELAFSTGDMVNRITFAPTFLPPGGNVQTGMQLMPFITYGYGQFNNPSAVSIGGTDHGLTWGVFGHMGF